MGLIKMPSSCQQRFFSTGVCMGAQRSVGISCLLGPRCFLLLSARFLCTLVSSPPSLHPYSQCPAAGQCHPLWHNKIIAAQPHTESQPMSLAPNQSCYSDAAQRHTGLCLHRNCTGQARPPMSRLRIAAGMLKCMLQAYMKHQPPL